MKIIVLAVLSMAILIISCDTNRVYEDTATFNKAYWLADSIKYFEFQIPDKTAEYNLLLSVRNGRDYPHSNLYVQYTILDSTRRELDAELRNFQLFHQKSGYPLGNGSGNIYEHNFNLLSGYQFPYAGKYFISTEQYMRYDSLPEIYSVGIRIETPDN
jgi:gliding motility-associated lipoprotein GldH